MIKLEALTGRHNRNEFDCGVDILNSWLRQIALQHQNKGISRTFVAVPFDNQVAEKYQSLGYDEIGEASILGFYALASAFVFLEDLPSDLAKRYPRQVPVTRLGRLAIRSDMQGQGLGRMLLADAVNRAHSAAQSVGSAGIFVDAKDGKIAQFYQSFGFRLCDDQPLKLYLPMW
ncbi:MAG: GNAT family N-acetyltransferase [Methylomonas sp.]|jgi:GNAT superfamily N-acetyltransferase